LTPSSIPKSRWTWKGRYQGPEKWSSLPPSGVLARGTQQGGWEKDEFYSQKRGGRGGFRGKKKTRWFGHEEYSCSKGGKILRMEIPPRGKKEKSTKKKEPKATAE